MKYDVIKAMSDLGLQMNGTKEGPECICENIKNASFYNVEADNIIKNFDECEKLKNLEAINQYNEKLYNCVTDSLERGDFPLILGGDHSIAIASALASNNYFNNLGIIWLDAHGDYNTEETTETGNIHGLPFAALTGYKNKKLVDFYKGPFFNRKNAVLVGARSIDDLEYVNLKDAGVTIFTTEDIKKYGMKNILDKAFEIASNGTNGIHISYDIDLIDPICAPGVSVPEENGINLEDNNILFDYLINSKKQIKSLDIVEYNPYKDVSNKTLNIVVEFLNKFIQ